MLLMHAENSCTHSACCLLRIVIVIRRIIPITIRLVPTLDINDVRDVIFICQFENFTMTACSYWNGDSHLANELYDYVNSLREGRSSIDVRY